MLFAHFLITSVTFNPAGISHLNILFYNSGRIITWRVVKKAGSEGENVIILFHKTPMPLITRKLIEDDFHIL